MRLTSRTSATPDHRELVPVHVRRRAAVDRRRIASTLTSSDAPEQDRRLSQRAEVLRAAVAVGVARGRPGGRRGSRRSTSATAATTSPLDSIPREISPRLPVARPTPSFRATSRPAAATMRACAAPAEQAGSPVCDMDRDYGSDWRPNRATSHAGTRKPYAAGRIVSDGARSRPRTLTASVADADAGAWPARSR